MWCGFSQSVSLSEFTPSQYEDVIHNVKTLEFNSVKMISHCVHTVFHIVFHTVGHCVLSSREVRLL